MCHDFRWEEDKNISRSYVVLFGNVGVAEREQGWSTDAALGFLLGTGRSERTDQFGA